MSCAQNKTDCTTNFNSNSYSSSGSNIGLKEETKSSNNECDLESVRGKIRLDLAAFPHGACQVYFKVAAKTDGSSNSPPVTADGLYHAALSATMGIVNTSAYYANTTPTFNGANDCSATDKQYGWSITDQIAAIQPNFTYYC